MSTAATSVLDSKLHKSPGKLGMAIFGGVLLIGISYAAVNLVSDLSGFHSTSILPYLLLILALLVALGFEFVNGFHDTANAVATVIYTHSLEPHIAVVWSGFWNFLGVLTSSGLVAFAIVSLLPVELILQVGSKAGFAMVFALLVAAIIWNLSTWYFGLPASSSHTLIGSIIGVGIANQLKGQIPAGFIVLNAGVNRDPGEIEAEVVKLVREKIGPVADFKTVVTVKRLPKTRSGKILRATMRQIADGEAYKMPATIDDPAILAEIAEALKAKGLPAKG